MTTLTKPLLLHIGTAKTGTTSIQDALAKACGPGASVSYPVFQGRDHNHLAALYLAHDALPPYMHHRHPRDDLSFRLFKWRQRRFMHRALERAERAVLSSEIIGWFLDAAAARRLRQDLEARGFDDFHVVMYVRDPADQYLSHLQQEMKSSTRQGIADFDPARYRYAFRPFAEAWEEAFPGRLVVRRYSRDAGFDVVEDFFSVLRSCLGVELQPPPPARKNRALHAESMRVLELYRDGLWEGRNAFISRDADRLIMRLEQLAAEVPQSRAVLKPEVAALIRANHLADAEFMQARYGLDLGLAGTAPAVAPDEFSGARIADLLVRVDRDTVERLLVALLRPELVQGSAPRPLPLRAIGRARRLLRQALSG